MEAKKFIGPTIAIAAAATVGIIIYRATTDYRNKLQKLPEFDPNYHIKLIAVATPAQKKIFADKVTAAYKININNIITAYIADKKDEDIEERGNFVKSLILLLPFIFGTPKPNKALRTMPMIENTIRNKFQFSIFLNRFQSYTNPTINLKEEIITKWDNKACFRLYKFLNRINIIS